MKKVIIMLLCIGMLMCNHAAVFAEDFYGGSYEDDTSKKVAVNTLNDVNVQNDNGVVSINVRSLEVQEVTMKDKSIADMLEIEQNRAYAAVTAYFEIENMTDHDVSVPVISTQIVTNTAEQARCDPLLCDRFAGKYYGRVKEDGAVTFLLPDSDPYEINKITFVFDSFFDETDMCSLDGFKITVEIPDDEVLK